MADSTETNDAPGDEVADDPVGDEVADALVGEEVQWYRDPDGTEWFVDDDVRFELADDGFAYPVVGGSTDATGSEPLDIVGDDIEDQWPAQDDAQDATGVEAADAASAADVDADDADSTADSDAEDGSVDHSPFAPPARGKASGDKTTRIITVRTKDRSDDVEDASAGEEAASQQPAPPSPAASTSVGNGAGDVGPLLDIRGLDAGYGSLPVLHGVDLQVQAGQTAVLLGLNGAGKTTTVSNVCGALSPWDGQIVYDGRDVGGWSTSKAVEAGVVMIPEGRRVFPDLSVARNLQVGAWGKRSDSDYMAAQRDRVYEYFPRLREREKQLAGTLSGGEQQMLAVGRGLMADPRLLIIDEASMGLAPVIVADVFDIVSQINDDGVTVLMVEQNVGVLEVADIGYVMEQGRVVRVLEGEELRDRAVVSEALMG